MAAKKPPRSLASRKLREILSPSISQAELARDLKVTQQAVSAWANDHAKPDVEKMLELEKRFGIAPKDWFASPDEEPAEEHPEVAPTPSAFPAAGAPSGS